jgi:hypothetical protein
MQTHSNFAPDCSVAVLLVIIPASLACCVGLDFYRSVTSRAHSIEDAPASRRDLRYFDHDVGMVLLAATDQPSKRHVVPKLLDIDLASAVHDACVSAAGLGSWPCCMQADPVASVHRTKHGNSARSDGMRKLTRCGLLLDSVASVVATLSEPRNVHTGSRPGTWRCCLMFLAPVTQNYTVLIRGTS